MDKHIKAMENHTDLNPWYWISYGEKCYAFAVIEAITKNSGDKIPKPGTQLQPDEDDMKVWIGENGTEMLIEEWIVEIERQNGDTICQFIAAAHAHFLGKIIIELEDATKS